MASIFGFEFRRVPEPESIKSFTPEVKDDGAVIVAAGGTYGTYIDLDGTVRTEAELVTKYRMMSIQPEIDKALNEIVNEAIVTKDDAETVELILDDLMVDDKLKDVIQAEFKEILDLLNFKSNAYNIFKSWYVDGRKYYHVVIDEKRPLEGIKELRYVDPRKIRKVREVTRKRDAKTEATIQTTRKEYYMYSEKGLNYDNKNLAMSATTASGIKISTDAIIHVTSGLTDENNAMGLSYLHPAIKFLNQLRSLEDATLIYHLSRAPERRVFNIEIGALPKMKAEQYVQDMMTKYKNRLVYNAATGEVRDDRKFMTMLEDFWFPKREGRGTEVSILSGGTALPDLLESVEYFQDRLYRALQVPVTRLKNDDAYSIGRATEISRDEVNFSKFIDRVRNKFNDLFILALEKQLILKKIAAPEDWEQIKKHIKFRYLHDNAITELKDLEIWNERMALLGQMAMLTAGKYHSHTWIRKNILKQSEDDIKENDIEINAEFAMPQFQPELVQSSMENDMDFEKQKKLASMKEDVETELENMQIGSDLRLKQTLITLLENENDDK